ncbi:MAG: hypothetical protein GC139_04655 [Sideroxydans sp.]|nr:hypothetical protein [Sideroxydans sp.]
MLKFSFSLKTRDGQTVDNIIIAARDLADAERKLRQMYRHCEIVNSEEQRPDNLHSETMSFEDIMTLISK